MFVALVLLHNADTCIILVGPFLFFWVGNRIRVSNGGLRQPSSAVYYKYKMNHVMLYIISKSLLF